VTSITLTFKYDKDCCHIVFSEQFPGRTGLGDNPLEAIAAWWDQIDDYYDALVEAEQALDDAQKRQLALLREINGAKP
jgi:hypothetical protein